MGRKASPNKNDFSTQIEEQEKNIALLKKEIHIEAALEKVRARTMAMQKTEELPQIINILFQQLQELSFDIYACSLVLINERMSQELWIAGYSKDILPKSYEIYYTDHLYFTHFIEAWQNGISYDFIKYEGQKKKDYDQYVFFKTGMSTLPEESKAEIMNIEKTFICAAYMKYGWIEINAEEGLPTDQANILQRFAKVFEQIYTRFLDLKKAEAQTREAEIQLALERVRARTMAMHRSEELGEVAILLYKEFNALKMGDFFNCGFVIVNEADSVQNGWMTQPEGDFIEELDLPYPGDSIFKERLNAWSEGNGIFCQKVTGEKLAEHIKYVSDRSISKNQLSTILPYMPDPCYFYCGNFKEGYLHIVAKEELVPEAEAILARFTKVFSQTYTRFLDLQKAERQAQEARIETALEKIRSNMMAMHQSDQLRQVVATMFEQLQNLGFDSSASVIHIYNDDLSAEQWMAGFSHGELPKSYHIPYCEHPYFTEEVSGWQAGLPFHELIFEGPQKVEYAKWMIEHSDYKFLPAEFHQEMLSPERIYISNAHMKYGLVEVWGAEPLPKKSINTLIRFAKVFEQTYTRFLDLQKAEEQARESQIEASMERVRARAMAMHTTGELNELVALIYDEIQKLGLFDYGCSIIICDEANKVLQFWYAEINQLQSFRCYNVPITSQSIVQEQYQSWKKGLTQFNINIKGKEHKEYIEFLLTETDHKELPEEVKEGWRSFSEVFFTYSNFKYGLLEFVDVKPIDKNNYTIYQRFAKVFEQTYTRFLDLQKAEKQAKEAQIETALEKVRSRTMAMHSSQELGEAVDTLLKQFKILGFDAISSWVSLMNPEENTIEFWTKHEEKLVAGQTVHISELTNFEKEMESWKKGEESIHLSMPFKLAKLELKKIFGIELVGEESNTFYLLQLRHKYGFLGLGTLKESNEEIRQTVQRFAKVFEQTYTRFLDLQKAEKQAKEAQIETALEKVRSRTMAMQKSEELLDLVKKIYSEIEPFGVSTTGITIALFREEENAIENWFADNLQSDLLQSYKVVGQKNKVFKQIWEDWKNKNPQRKVYLEGPDKRAYDNYILTETDYRQLPEELKEEIHSHKTVCFTLTYFKYGYFESVDLTIPAEENAKILLRFAKVFEQTYTRFLDLQKAEAQAKEAEIELALERVRARTMAMHHSDELIEVVKTLNKQFLELRPESVANWLSLVNVESNSMKIIGSVMNGLLQEFIANGSELPSYQNDLDEFKKGIPNWQFSLPKEEILRIWRESFVIDEAELPEAVTEYHLLHTRHAFGFFGFGSWEKADEETIVILSRFAKVFEQTYTRFLDLQKAEIQAREAEIQLALERVRARAMAMHQSQELAEVVALMYGQIQSLGFTDWGCAIIICDEEGQIMHYWYADINMSHLPDYFKVPITNKTIKKTWELWKQGTPQFIIELHDEKMAEYADFMLEETDHKNLPQEVKDGWRSEKNVYFSYSNIKYGLLEFTEVVPFKEENLIIYQRFAHVLEQTYTRFLDLQKAEAQAREAEIELALERVRAKTMAMQKSDELSDVAALLFKQIKILGAKLWTISIAFCKEDELIVEKWGGSPITDQIFAPNFIPYNADHGEQSMYDTWKNKVELYSYVQEGKVLKDIYDHLMTIPSFKANFQKVIDAGRPLPVWQKNHVVSFKYGYLLVITEEEFKEEYIFTRFAKVFEQTYTRFLDLQKAETQTREAQIEAALERVRSRSMAMYNSEELIQVATVLHDEINTLAILPASSVSLIIVDEEKLKQRFWGSKSATGFLQQIDLPLLGDTILKKRYEAWKRKEPLFSQKIKGEQLRKHLEIVMPANTATKKVSESKILMPDPAYFYFANFSYGAIQLLNAVPIDDETTSLLLRFAKVFEQTYTRFLDLQKAEEQAKEALKQSSLDRVRGEIASMRSTADLERITPLVWNELTTLGVPFIRCGVSIIHEETQDIEMFLSTPNGESLAMMNLDYTSSDLTQNSIDHWRKNKVYHQHWSKEEFVSWTKTLMERGQISNNKAYQGSEAPPETLELYFVPFTQGSLYVGAIEELSDEEIEMVKALAKAFSIAYARYEDFVKLEKAKDSIEATLAELKNTQKQLIQSEKMASLGELTAGIAHEIQNPLNFVNNFSEASSEMIDEMKEEIDKGQIEEARMIAGDIKQNLEKINHHGQRASDIVKSMLQHSRTSSGTREPTDINALADEYLRLAYHGLRAKDKSFNVDFKADLDPSLPKLNVIPQDIGRVLLNLINNAFYAVNERSKKGEPDYVPSISVTTQLTANSQQLIVIKDNGEGIPDEIVNKIFQPFFTTKPTGQGTGLGLSLSYDIITKGHNGTLEVDTTAGVGSEFIIQLPIV
jgi:signal transduction histidine kinase